MVNTKLARPSAPSCQTLGARGGGNQLFTIKYTHQDILGSTALITDSAGAIAHQYGYDPFGNLASELGEVDKSTNYLYTGQELDPESDLYYYNARYYNPILGRFLSKDPIIHRADGVLGFNEYIYVKNNPLKYVDPSGNEKEKAWYENAWNSVVNSDYVQAPAGLVVGASEGVWSTVTGVGNMVLHPIDTAVGLWNFGGQAVNGTVDYATKLYNDPSKTLSNTYSGASSWVGNTYSDFSNKSTFEKWRTVGFGGEKIAEVVLLTKGAGTAIKGVESVKTAEGIEALGSAALKTTTHGAEQLAIRGFSVEEVVFTKTANVVKTQADGATVYIKAVGGNKFNVIVEGDGGIITGMKNLDQKALDNLAKNYNWK